MDNTVLKLYYASGFLKKYCKLMEIIVLEVDGAEFPRPENIGKYSYFLRNYKEK